MKQIYVIKIIYLEYITKKKIQLVWTIFPRVEDLLKNLLSSQRYKWIVDESTQAKDKWIIESPGYGETRINGLKTYCKVDFLVPFSDNAYVIDWKTGKEDESTHNNNQLIRYASWAADYLNIHITNVKPIISYLSDEYKEIELPSNEYTLEDFYTKV